MTTSASSDTTVLAAGIVLYRRATAGTLLLLLRDRDRQQWGFAKGRRDPGDRHEVATALREVAEETGYDTLTLRPDFRRELDYVVRDDSREPYTKRVTYFLAAAPAAEPRLSSEHDDHLWVDVNEATRRLSYGQLRDLALEVQRALESEPSPSDGTAPGRS